MDRSRTRTAVSVLAALVLALGPASAPGDPPAGSPSDGDPRSGLSMSLPQALVGDHRPDPAREAADVTPLRPPPGRGLRVLLVSSGVDETAFPEPLRSRFRVLWGEGDALGYGTYAASVLLQLVEDLEIVSIAAYEGDRLNPYWHETALGWALEHREEVDAVLYAMPPSDFVDPATLLLASGGASGSEWSTLLEALGDHPVRGRSRTGFGIATVPDLRALQQAAMTGAQRAATDRWAGATWFWGRASDRVEALAAAGLPPIVPAGDLGPELQTVFGIANLPGAIAVGAADGAAVARSSSSGPSIDMRAKPDLVAPSGLVGLVPERSLLGRRLPEASAGPEWFAAMPPGSGKAIRAGSTIAAAAVVAAQVASLEAAGIGEGSLLRGALVAGAEPLPGIAVWRQGAGLLDAAVPADRLRARGVATARADLGDEPATGAWTARVPFWGAAPAGASTRLTGFAGVDLDGTTGARRVDLGDVATSVSGAEVVLSTSMGPDRDGGLYCGYLTVALPATPGFPVRSGDGLPAGAREDVPACLLNGSPLTMHGFYIHDQPAEDLTFALLPEIPERETVLDGVLRRLPVDPTKWPLFQAVTGPDGNAVMRNVPPGYYRFRQFSDYGSPVSFSVRGPAGAPVTVREDAGRNPAYQDVVLGYLLGRAGVTEADLRAAFGSDNVRQETSGAYAVTVGPRTIRVVLGFLKKMPGAAVASRVVDLMSRGDFEYLVADLPAAPSPEIVLSSPDDIASVVRSAWPLAGDGWLFEGVNAPAVHGDRESIRGRYNGAGAAGAGTLDSLVGVARYRFNLTSPNYLVNLSLSFGYEIQNAAVVALLEVGGETGIAGFVDALGAGVRTDDARGPEISMSRALSSGAATLDIDVISHGATSGTLTLLTVPAQALSNRALPVAQVALRDLSMRVSTWTTSLWPATVTPKGPGHAFEVDPNLAGMDHRACRAKAVGDLSYEECGDWVVLVHSPGDDAATVAVRRGGEDLSDSLARAGGAFFDPQRGSTAFFNTLTLGVSLPELDAGLGPRDDMRTNGRFWEQLSLPLEFLRANPGRLTFEIVDNAEGRATGWLPHRRGAVPVAPYLPYGR